MFFDSNFRPGTYLPSVCMKTASAIMWLVLSGLLAISPAQAADAVAGAKLYAQHCKKCHGNNGQGQLPGLPDFSRGNGLLESDIVLRNRIFAGQGMMPAYRGLLSEQEVLDIIAYLRTLHR